MKHDYIWIKAIIMTPYLWTASSGAGAVDVLDVIRVISLIWSLQNTIVILKTELSKFVQIGGFKFFAVMNFTCIFISSMRGYCAPNQYLISGWSQQNYRWFLDIVSE